jgi:hypothetical protein
MICRHAAVEHRRELPEDLRGRTGDPWNWICAGPPVWLEVARYYSRRFPAAALFRSSSRTALPARMAASVSNRLPRTSNMSSCRTGDDLSSDGQRFLMMKEGGGTDQTAAPSRSTSTKS